MQVKYLIIGGSAAGINAANIICRLQPDADVLCVTAEGSKPYNKCFLVDWIAREKAEQQVYLSVNPQVKMLHNSKVISLDSDQQIAVLDDGTEIGYQKALLCIGVQAFRPPIKGINDYSHIFNFHSFVDTQKLLQFIEYAKPQRAVVIGAGLTGLECADALATRGLQVSVVERSPHVLGNQVDIDGAQVVEDSMRNLGISFYGGAEVVAIDDKFVHLNNGKILPADLVITAIGVRPNKIAVLGQELKYAGSHVQVDDFLQTNLQNVWAAGDMIAVPDLLTGAVVPSCSWPDAMMQGALAAQNMLGKSRRYPGMLSVANSHFFGKDFISCGSLDGNNVLPNQALDSYQKCVVSKKDLVEGFLLIGSTDNYPKLRRAAMTGQSVAL
jgi:nitrite reductase (NADH) large subunit